MKRTILIMVFFIVVAMAVFGCLVIFEVINPTTAWDFLFKFVAAVLLIGICSILIGLLMKNDSE